MKQSKYSKRRPKHDEPYYVGKPNHKGLPNSYVVIKPKILDEYDVGIFLDDERTLESMEDTLPKCKKWYVFTNLMELYDFMDEWDDKFDSGELDHSNDTLFISFDYYLKGHTSTDGVIALRYLTEPEFKSVTFTGHSSDESMNQKNINLWYGNKAVSDIKKSLL